MSDLLIISPETKEPDPSARQSERELAEAPDPPPPLVAKDRALAYRPRLDGLRCFAISLVMIEHFGGSLAGLIAGGYYGVDLFFVISGYLITNILLKGSDNTFATGYRTFVGRRALRIFPAYYLLLAILFLINFEPAREMFPTLATYTFNYAAAIRKASGNENHLYYLWSLSVEEQFYLVWPALVISLRGNKQLMVGVTVAVAILGYLQLALDIVPPMSQFNYTGLFNRMGSLGLGAFGAAYVSWRSLPEKFFRSLSVEICVFVVLGLALISFSKHSPIPLGLCSLYLVLKAVHFEFRLDFVNRLLAQRWIVYVGGISYGIYLFHVPTGVLFTRYIFDPLWSTIPFESFGLLSKLQWHSWILKLPLFSVLSIATAAASYRWFEAPVLALKDRWFRYN